MNEICLHCQWLYFSSIILRFGQCEVDQAFCMVIFFQIIHIVCNQTLMALLQNTFDAFKFLHWMSVHENLRKPIFTYEIPLVYEKGLHTY